MAPAAELGPVILAAPLLDSAAPVEDALVVACAELEPLLDGVLVLLPVRMVTDASEDAADDALLVRTVTDASSAAEEDVVALAVVVTADTTSEAAVTGAVAIATLWPVATTPLPSVLGLMYKGWYVPVSVPV